MSLRSLSILVAGALLATSASADRLLVTGPQGMVFQADPEVGTFEYFACACGGPIEAMAADKERLYTADTFGNLLVFDVETGAILDIHTPPSGPFTSLTTGEGFLFAGNADGEVVRIDPATGGELDSRALPSGVAGLLAHRGFLYAAGADSAIYRAPTSGGQFTYFSCFCFFDLQGMAVQEDLLFVVDVFGTTAHIDLATGEIVSAVWVGNTNTLAIQDGDLLVHSGAGVIGRRDMATGQELPGGYQSPIEISAMLVLKSEVPQGDWDARTRPSK